MPQPTMPLTPLERISSLLLAAVAVLTGIFLIAPILAIVPLGFSDGEFLVYPIRAFSLKWMEAFFASEKWSLAVKNSFAIGAASAVIAAVLGTAAAVGLARSDFPGKKVVTALLLSPLVVPVVIYAVGLYFFFAPLGLTQTYTGIVLAHAALGSPFVVVTVGASLAGFDHNLMRAAASLGAPPLLAFRRVMLPLVLPGVVTGTLFAFAASFDEVVTVLFLAAPQQRTIPREMFSGLRESLSPMIAAASIVMMVAALLLLVAVELLKRRTERMQAGRKDAA
ncbi:ABC transporter permease [Prosthecomicrobium sp. N25]|uniref:ABC transporter permease n=1 Tax=Prosthecomicrobium sp. N25 TaxID=3129254 RepID=UPI003076F914